MCLISVGGVQAHLAEIYRATARPAPPAALAGLAAPPPVPRPPSPPALEWLRRDSTMIM